MAIISSKPSPNSEGDRSSNQVVNQVSEQTAQSPVPFPEKVPSKK